jgi:hypothetical protein
MKLCVGASYVANWGIGAGTSLDLWRRKGQQSNTLRLCTHIKGYIHEMKGRDIAASHELPSFSIK